MRRREGVTDQHIERILKMGYGQGEGATYKPLSFVRDVPSVGEGWQMPVLLTPERLIPHQYHSRLEMTTGCIHERLGATQIREQFALLCSEGTREETIAIAKELGVKHPTIPRTSTLAVMSTDLLVDRPNGNTVAIYCKPRAHLDPTTRKGIRNLEKQSIEAIYWARRNTKFVVVTEETYPEVFKDNVVDIRSRLFQFEHEAVRPRIEEAATGFKQHWTPSRTLVEIIRLLADTMGLTVLQATHLVYVAVWGELIRVDLSAERFHPSKPVILE
jgi:hypothetical protein